MALHDVCTVMESLRQAFLSVVKWYVTVHILGSQNNQQWGSYKGKGILL